MPLWILIRIARALATTFAFVLNVRVMRALPWSYIATLPRTKAFIGIATISLAIALAASAATAILPLYAARAAYVIGMGALVVGIGSSWLRWVIQWRRLRRG